MQKLNPKCRNRCKQLVVERKLVPTKSESNHKIVSMNIIAQETKPSEIPVKPEMTSLKNTEIASLVGNNNNCKVIDEAACTAFEGNLFCGRYF